VTSGRTSSAVLVPLFRDGEGELRVLLVRRGMRGIHGGQIGFPGGKHEQGDVSPLATALRETEEEVGLGREQIEVLGGLEPMNTRTTGFRVYPFLARITPPRRWRLADGEIAGALTPTVGALCDPMARAEREFSFPTWPASLRVPCVLLDGEETVLWGLTLRVLDALLPRVLAGEWDV
jgi:8-oxo-dGTP pyrophosphatase MutT (NUDIX family)